MPSSAKLGYQDNFLGSEVINLPLMHIVSDSNYELAELIDQPNHFILDYLNYSVIMDKVRKFPILSASNIDGKLFKTVSREGSWKLDPRIDRNAQWGADLYQADQSIFDKGHMTKREDVQWGTSEEIATEAAKSTFYYTNAIPQHARLNRSVWRSIESYILKSETVKHHLKVTVLTGPVLRANDPAFVTPVNGEIIKIPILFWKIIYYTSANGELFRTAFLVSQKEVLERDKIIKKIRVTRSTDENVAPPLFLRFKKADTYQIKVDLIEDLTGLKFPVAGEKFQDDRPQKLILKQINVRGLESGIESVIKNLVL